MKAIRPFRPSRKSGFTLVEIMVVVVIIGLLASMAISSFIHSRRNSISVRLANDLRVYGDAFNQYVFEEGVWPEDGLPGGVPAGMEDYLPGGWREQTAAGGRFDWDKDVFGVVAAVSIYAPTVEDEVLQRIDEILDDGDLATGRARKRANGYMLVLEE